MWVGALAIIVFDIILLFSTKIMDRISVQRKTMVAILKGKITQQEIARRLEISTDRAQNIQKHLLLLEVF